MGKDKDIKERRKKNVKGPSSSAAAAEFASKRGFGDAFARFKASAIVSQDSGGDILASFDAISDPTLRTNFKHLNKRDPTTRIKALSHIAANVRDKPQQEIVQILPEWIATLKKLVLDNTRRVREQSFIVFQLIIEIVTKELGPYLKSTMGIWLISMHDHDHEVATAAQNAFNSAFPTSDKREKALKFCEQEIMDQLISNFQLTVQTLSDSKSATQSEAEERYNRYISSSIDALEYLIRNAKVQNEKFSQICSNKNFWKFLTIKNFGDIRASTFKLVATVSTVTPELIEPNLETISPLILGCFNETDPVVHESMINSLITFMKQFPSAWNYVKPWKAIFPRLWSFLKNPETSSPSKTFQTLLPFVAMLDFDVMGGSNEQSFKFFDQFFTSMWIGYTSDRVQAHEKQIILNTLTEVCMYCLLQAKKYVKEENELKYEEAINIFVSSTFRNHFEKAVKYYLTTPDISKDSAFCKSLCVALAKFMSREQMTKTIRAFWSDMTTLSISELNNTARLRSIFSTRIHSLLEGLKEQDQSLVHIDYLLTFAGDVFYDCLANAFEHDSNLHLKTAFRLAGVIPLDELLASSTDQSALLSPTVFYHERIVPMFTKYLTAEETDKSSDFIHSLYGIIGQFFNIYPIHFSEFDVILEQLVMRPSLLLVLVMGIYSAQSNTAHRLHNNKLDQILIDYSEQMVSVFREGTNAANFVIYVDLIEYLTVDQHIPELPVVQHILRNVEACIDSFGKQSPERREELEAYVVRLVKYLTRVLPLQTNHQDRLFLNLLKQIFDLRVFSKEEVMYISDLFYDTCVQIGAILKKDEELVEEDITYSSKPDQFPFFDSLDAENARDSQIVAVNNNKEIFENPEMSKDNLSGYDSDSEEEIDNSEGIVDEEQDEDEYEDEEEDEDEHVEYTSQVQQEVQSSTDSSVNRVADAAHDAWKHLYHSCITETNAKIFIEEVVQALHKTITDPTSLTISHSQLLMQADTLEAIAIDVAKVTPSTVWDHLIFEKSIWQNLRNACEGILRQIAIGNDIFLLPFTNEQDISRVVTNIQLYGRFLCFALDKLFVYVTQHHLFKSSSVSSLNNLWLVTEIIHSSQTQLAVNESTLNIIKDFMSQSLLPFLLSSSGKMTLGTEFVDRFVEVCRYLLSLAEADQSYYKDLRLFIMNTLTFLYQESQDEMDDGKACKALRDLFSSVCDNLLFREDLETLLSSKTKCLNFANIIEAFFSAYLDSNTFAFVVSKLRSGLHRKLVQEEDRLYDSTITWISQCASILMQITQEIASKTFNVQRGDELMNLLRVQSSLAIFLNHLKDPEENIVSMHFVVSVTSEFANSLLASDFANEFMDQVDLIVSRMLFYVYRNTLDGGLALDEQNDEFLVSFVEQHITRCISLLSAGAFSFDEVSRMAETLYYMVELSVSFLQSRKSNLDTTRRVYSQLLNTLNALADFQKLLETEPTYRKLKIFQRVNDRLINDIAISIRDIPADIFTAIDRSFEGDMKFSMSLLNILKTSTSIHALITAHDLLRKHQDTSYFVIKEEVKSSANIPDVVQPEEKLVLLPELVSLLKKPHYEVKLSPIYEHLKWVNMHEFIDRNEERNIHYRMLPYFLAWSIVAHLYDQGNDDQKAAIFATLKENQSFITLLNAITSYLLTGSGTNKYGLMMHEIINEKDLTSTDTSVTIAKRTKSMKSMADAVTHESISLLGAQVFFRLMKTYPSLIRHWYINCIGNRTIKHVTAFVTTKVCPIVIDYELEDILANTKTDMPDHVRVRVTKGRNLIVATYEQDEVQLDISVSIPADYPLKALKIESSKRLGVSEMQWRKWTLKMTTVLFSHEGKLWDALMLWKQNLDRHFEGVEPCPICYSIVHTHDHALPKIRCKVCKSKYHGACLYKWFTTSGHSSCPTCRSTNSFL